MADYASKADEATTDKLMAPVSVSYSDLIKVQNSEATPEQMQALFRATPKSKISERPAKGGGKWKYVRGSYAKQVLNVTFGMDGWSFELLTPVSEALESAKSGSVVVLGRLTLYIGSKTIVRQQYGGSEVKLKKDTNIPLDFGNDVKAAGTDALKKCMADSGFFYDVYAAEDALELKLMSDSDVEEETAKAHMDIADAKTVGELNKLFGTLSAKTQAEVREAMQQKLDDLRGGNG